ncbi:SPOR domain-containing protein [uncultured Devosia sp.]|uniref:SPOR domain-containing protein n=1 Tax=uncultured Devosia sp. TaxID=211434 RepID=UPI0035C9A80C
MTTGKPQPVATPSNPSDDLIAELSRLMAQDAQGSRQDAPMPTAPAPEMTNSQVSPFAVRIPGTAPSMPEAVQAPRVDVAPEAAAVPQRQEPSFAAPVAPEPVPVETAADPDEPTPFSFDFDFGKPRQQPAPEPVPQPADALNTPDDHDAIADLIATELLAGGPPPASVMVSPPAAAAVVEQIRVAPVTPELVKPASWMPTPVTRNAPEQAATVRSALRPVNLTPIQRTEKPQDDAARVSPAFAAPTAPVAVPPTAVPAAPEPVAFVKPRAEHGYLSPVPSEPAMAPPANDLELGLDPIEEIESLIGRAVKVELESARGAARPIASPALRSLATPVAPPAYRPISGADEAIMAAAAATGAEVGWVEQHEEQQVMDTGERRRAPRRGGLLRAVAGPLIAVVLLLAAGFGLYSVLGLGGSDGPAPVLVADTTPIKQVPQATTTADPVPQSIVFNEMDGVVPGAEEQLVSRDQADVNEVTAIPPAADISTEGLANRKVRTVTVRPDGTIVSGEDSVAGTAMLPVDRPNVPEVPGADTPTSDLLASAQAMQPTPAPVAPAPEPPAVAPLVPGSEIAVIDATGAPVAGKTAPVPYARPASVGDAPATGPVTATIETPPAPLQAAPLAQPVSAELAAAPQAPAAVPAVGAAGTRAPIVAPAYAQLSSQRSPEDAQRVADDLSARYASMLNGTNLEVSRVDLGARGIYYRVRVPAATREGAAQLCASITGAGGDCVAM